MSKYEKIEKVGEGGFAEVWKCSRRLDTTVLAQKILLHKDLNSRKRFGREIKILSKLNHPNIIKIYDYEVDLNNRNLRSLEREDSEPHPRNLQSLEREDSEPHLSNLQILEHEDSELRLQRHKRTLPKKRLFMSRIRLLFDGLLSPAIQEAGLTKTSFIIMPYYKYSLDDLIPKIIGNEKEIAKIYSSILKAMKYAHSKEIIHRDLHPRNILLNSPDDVVVADFGIGRQISSLTSRITSTGESLGIYPFIAEEQAIDMKRAGKPADVHSLGMLLYYLYTGRTSPILQLSISDSVFEVICKCINHAPQERYADAEQLQQAWTSLRMSFKKTRIVN